MPNGHLRSTHPNVLFQPATDRAVACLPLPVSSRIGARLRLLLRRTHASERQVAESLGIDQTFIQDLEQGRRSLSLPLLEVLALGLNLSISEILSLL